MGSMSFLRVGVCCCFDKVQKDQDEYVKTVSVLGNAEKTQKLRASLLEKARLDVAYTNTVNSAKGRVENTPDQDDAVWEVVLTPYSDGRLGLIMRMRPLQGMLSVESVQKPSPAEDWNNLHPDKEVLAGDMVIEVNGKRGRFAGDGRGVSEVHDISFDAQKAFLKKVNASTFSVDACERLFFPTPCGDVVV